MADRCKICGKKFKQRKNKVFCSDKCKKRFQRGAIPLDIEATKAKSRTEKLAEGKHATRGQVEEEKHLIPHPTRDYVAVGLRYIEDVINGSQIAGKLIQRACERTQAALNDERYYLNADKVNAVCDFIESLPHVKEKWSTPHIHLEPWQIWAILDLMGLCRKEDARRVRTQMYLSVARKNAKSTTFGAALSLWFLLKEGTVGPYCGIIANSHRQATEVFSIAKKMAKRCLNDLEYVATAIRTPDGDILESLHSDSQTLDGYNFSFGFIDEVHEAPDSKVIEVVRTSMAARSEPVLIMATTAGSTLNSPAYEIEQSAEKVLYGLEKADGAFYAIYHSDVDDDPTDAAVWIKANPNLDVSVRKEAISEALEAARLSPSAYSAWLRYRQNTWTRGSNAWLSPDLIQKSMEDLSEIEVVPSRALIGVDLGSGEAFDAAVLLLEDEDGTYHCWTKIFLPRATIEADTTAPLKDWRRRELLTEAGIDAIDHSFLYKTVGEWDQDYTIEILCHDVHSKVELEHSLEDLQTNLLDVKQSRPNLSPAMFKLRDLMSEGKIKFNGEPFAYQLGNLEGEEHSDSTVYPVSPRGYRRDSVSALLNILYYLFSTPEGLEGRERWDGTIKMLNF